jgi:hypothetical protein
MDGSINTTVRCNVHVDVRGCAWMCVDVRGCASGTCEMNTRNDNNNARESKLYWMTTSMDVSHVDAQINRDHMWPHL